MRLPNLLIIALTLLLLRLFIFMPALAARTTGLLSSWPEFLILVAATILTAAGGYLVNDLFDQEADRINRPGRRVVGISVSVQAARGLYILLNVMALAGGAWLAFRAGSAHPAMIFPLVAALLWLYSARLKGTPLAGNALISFLSALVILVAWYFEYVMLRNEPERLSLALTGLRTAALPVMVYAFFAFLTSMIREIVKDMEDIEGDRAAGYRTLPVSAGLRASTRVAGAILVLTIFLTGLLQISFLARGNTVAFWYFMVLVQPVFLVMLLRFRRTSTQEGFRQLSRLAKAAMVAGLASMILYF